MRFLVTVHVFSGRPDPTFLLSDAQSEELQKLLRMSESSPTLSKPAGVDGRLGYRGFSVEQLWTSVVARSSFYVHAGVVDRGIHRVATIDESGAIESLLAAYSEPYVSAEVLKHLTQQISTPKSPIFSPFSAEGCPQCQASDAPSYNPDLWNDPATQPYNNCYNYANDQVTNTFAQPGRAHGQAAAAYQCPDVSANSQADGLQSIPDFAGALSSGEGWYVALVVWPDQDFHWYRQDDVGCWSHKPGQNFARNVDNSGNSITDPNACDRGPYTDFCGYMITSKSVVIQ